LGRLLLYNLLWFFGLWYFYALFASRLPLILQASSLLAASLFSLLWAYPVFRTMMGDGGGFREIGRDWGRFALRSTLLTAASGAVYLLGALNIRFFLQWQGAMQVLGWVLTGVTVWFLLFWTGASLYQWPLLFFQDVPLGRVLYRSFLLFLANSWSVLFFLLLGALSAYLFAFPLKMIPWSLLGLVLFFSFQCVALEMHLLRYRITFKDAPLREVLDRLEKERKRTWREFFRPWETR
jgi:hypothetical protein